MEEKIKLKLEENIERILNKKIINRNDVLILKDKLYEIQKSKKSKEMN